MFALHETTRKALCRLGFVLLCVLPACAILAVAAGLRTRSFTAWHERALSVRLAQNVSVERVVLTDPHGVRYDGIEVSDPETGRLLARADSLRVSQVDEVLWIVAHGAEFAADHLDQLGAFAAQRLRLGKPGEEIRAAVGKMVVHLPRDRQLALEDVRAQLTFSQDEAALWATFLPVDRQSAEPISLRLTRNRQTIPATKRLELSTGKSRLPCELVTPYFSAAAQLGDACSFCGDILAVESPTGWISAIDGEFLDVNLRTLVARHFPSKLEGSARLQVRAAVQDGRLSELSGLLQCGSGSMHSDMLETLTRAFSLTVEPGKTPLDASYHFSELAFEFGLNAQGLALEGRCQTAKTPGAVLVDRRGAAVGQPRGPLPLASLEAAFAASRAELLSVLPFQEPTRSLR